MNEQISKELLVIAERLVNLAQRLSAQKAAVSRVKKDMSTCVTCGKPIPEGHRPVRGAHYKCYRRLIRMVREGLISEDEVVRSGKLLPPEPGGRNPSAAKFDYAASIREAARQVAERVEGLSPLEEEQE